MIEERISLLKLDCIVLGLGPTGWLVPHMRQSLFGGIRWFGPHDVFSIRPVDDLVVMDAPNGLLNQDSERHHRILTSRPERCWVYEPFGGDWLKFFPPELALRTKLLKLKVWDGPSCTGLEPFRLESKPDPETIAVSPTGCTTLAWREGCRRIGVIGTDMMHGHHDSAKLSHQVDCFFVKMARQAFDAGGLIVNLSPITSLQGFAAQSQHLWRTERVLA